MPAPQYVRPLPELLPAVAVMLPPVMVILLLSLWLAPPMPAPLVPPVAVRELSGSSALMVREPFWEGSLP